MQAPYKNKLKSIKSLQYFPLIMIYSEKILNRQRVLEPTYFQEKYYTL